MTEDLSPEILGALERLAGAGFELLPLAEVTTHYVVARGGFVAMVERREDGSFGTSGNPGKLTDRGFALFVRRGERNVFATKGHEAPASDEEAKAVRAFAADLRKTLEG